MALDDQAVLPELQPLASEVDNCSIGVANVAPSTKRRLFPIFRSTGPCRSRSGCSSSRSFSMTTACTKEGFLVQPLAVHLVGCQSQVMPVPFAVSEGTRSMSAGTVEIHRAPIWPREHWKIGSTKRENRGKWNIPKQAWKSPSQEDFLSSIKSKISTTKYTLSKTNSTRISNLNSACLPTALLSEPISIWDLPRPSLNQRALIFRKIPPATKCNIPTTPRIYSDKTKAGAWIGSETENSQRYPSSSSENRVSIPPTLALHGSDETQKQEFPCKNRSGFLQKTHITVPDPKNYSPLSQYCLQHISGSLSPESPLQMWLRRKGSSSDYSLPPTMAPLKAGSDPYWVIEEAKIQIRFPNDIWPGIYEVEIEANILLSTPDGKGWLEFILPGIPPLQEAALFGNVDFQIGLLSNQSKTIGETKYDLDKPGSARAQFDTSFLTDVITSPDRMRVSGRFCPQGPKLLRLRLKSKIFSIDTWDGSVTFCTTPLYAEGADMHLSHHATLEMETSKMDIFADRLSFSFLIKNGGRSTREYELKSGQNSIDLEERSSQMGCLAPNDEAEIKIFRDTEELGIPLEIFLVSRYGTQSPVSIALPTIRPVLGKLFSEQIILIKPRPPLIMKHMERGYFGTWKRIDKVDGPIHSMRFSRVELPHLFPEGLKDDVVVRFMELPPIRFTALEPSDDGLDLEKTSELIWDLNIQIDKVCGRNLECRMKLRKEVGESERVLTFDAQSWVPDLSIINGRLATQEVGEWREDEKGYMAMFRPTTMLLGQVIEVEMRWRVSFNLDNIEDSGVNKPKLEYDIPKIIGRSVLGGSFTCKVGNGMHQASLRASLPSLTYSIAMLILDDGQAQSVAIQFSNMYSQNKIQLPKLRKNYNMRLYFRPMIPRSPRIVRFEDECSSSSSSSSDASQETDDRVEPIIEGESPISLELDQLPRVIQSSRYGDEILDLPRHHFGQAIATFRSLVVPLLLITAAQILLAQIGNIWVPSATGSFFLPTPRPDADSKWIENRASRHLERSLPHPQATESRLKPTMRSDAIELVSTHVSFTTREFHERGQDGETNVGISSIAAGEPERARSSSEVTGMIDWIDRALGWKDVTA